MKFERAEMWHLECLRELAYQSESYWGGCEEFMEKFDEKYNITDTFLEKYPVYIGTEQDNPVCFWGGIPKENKLELEFFYVAPKKIGEGYGAVMWRHLTDWCRKNNMGEIELVTSAQAVGFYEKMGAVVSGETLSIIDGRVIPKLRYLKIKRSDLYAKDSTVGREYHRLSEISL